MRMTRFLVAVASVLIVLGTVPAAAQAPAGAGPQPPASSAGEPTAVPRGSETNALGAVDGPLTAVILQHGGALGLSSEQIEKIERLSAAFIRDVIRRQADLEIARLDLADVLEPDPADPAKPVDLAKAEAQIRRLQQLTGEFAMAVVRTTEAAKAELTADQRSRLAVLLTGDDSDDAAGRAGGTGHARPGGTPPGAGHARPGGAPGHPSHPGGHEGHRIEPHRDFHGRFFVGPSPHWDPYWRYRYYAYAPPAIAYAPPPVYIEQAPPPQSYWYYCPSTGAYYPYVQVCDQPWVLVPAITE